MARGKIGTPEEEQREATAAQNQADNVLSTAIVDTFKALAAQEHADNEAAEADAAKGWDAANKERKKVGLGPVKKTREQKQTEKFEQNQADWEKQRERADWYENEQHSFDAWRNQQNKEKLEKQEAEEHAKNKETLQKVGRYGEMGYRRAPDKVVKGKGLEKPTESKKSPKFSDAGDIANTDFTKNPDPSLKSTSTGPRPGEQYKDVNEGKAGYEDWQQRHEAKMAELKAKMDKILAGKQNQERLARNETRAKNLEEARKVVSTKPNSEGIDLYNNDDKYESSLTSSEVDDVMGNILKAYGFTDQVKRAPGLSAEPKKEEKSFDSLKNYHEEIKTPKKGKPSIPATPTTEDVNKLLEDYSRVLDNPSDKSISDIQDKISKLMANLDTAEAAVNDTTRNDVPLALDIKRRDKAKAELDNYLASTYKDITSKIKDINNADIKESFKNKAVRSRGAGMSLYTGNTTEGKKLSERALNKLAEDYKTEQEGFKANEAIAIKQRASLQSLYAKMKNTIDANIQKLLNDGMDEDNPRIQRLRKNAEDLQSKMDAAAQSSTYADTALANTVSDYNNFLRAMTKGQYSALGDLSRFGALGLTPDDIEQKFPLKRYTELLNIAKNVWPRQDDKAYNEALQKLIDDGMDPTEAKHQLNRENNKGKTVWVNKQLGPLYRALGGTEDDAVPFYIDDLVASGMDPESARREVITAEAKNLQSKLHAVGDEKLRRSLTEAADLSSYFDKEGESKIKAAEGEPEVLSRKVVNASEIPGYDKSMEKLMNMKTGGAAPVYEVDKDSDEYKNQIRYFNEDTREHLDNAMSYAIASLAAGNLPEEVTPLVEALVTGTSKEELEKEIKSQIDRAALKQRAMSAYPADSDRYAKAESDYFNAIEARDAAKAMLDNAPEDPQGDLIKIVAAIAKDNGDNPMEFAINPHEKISLDLQAENYANAKSHAFEAAMKYLAEHFGADTNGILSNSAAPLNSNVLSALSGDVSPYYKAKYRLK